MYEATEGGKILGMGGWHVAQPLALGVGVLAILVEVPFLTAQLTGVPGLPLS